MSIINKLIPMANNMPVLPANRPFSTNNRIRAPINPSHEQINKNEMAMPKTTMSSKLNPARFASKEASFR